MKQECARTKNKQALADRVSVAANRYFEGKTVDDRQGHYRCNYNFSVKQPS